MADSETRPLLGTPGDASLPSYTNTQSRSSEDPAAVPRVDDGEVSEARPKVRMLTVLLPISLGTFLAAMDGTIVASSYASIGSDLRQLQNTSWLATGYMLTLTSFQPLYGKLSDIFGRKACLLFAYLVFGLGCVACGLARNMTELIAARAFAGIGGGGMTTVVSILVSDIVPLRQRGTWQGVLNIIFSLGSASGAPLGGFLADSVGWRWAFLLQFPVTLIAFFSVLLTLHLPSTTTSTIPTAAKLRRVDFLGAFALVLAVFNLLFGLDHGSNYSWSSPFSYGSLIASFFLFIFFAIIETTPKLAKEPFAPKAIMANPSLLGSYLTNFFGMGAVMCTVFHVSLYAQAVHGRSAAAAGTLLIPPIIAGVTGSLLSGVIMQRTGKYKLLTVCAGVGIVLGASVIDTMTMLSIVGGLIGVTIGFTIMQFGLAITITSTLVALIANVTSAEQAIATAVSYLFRSLGGVVGLSVGSAVIQNTLRADLAVRLNNGGQDIEEIVRRVRESLSYIDSLDPATRAIVRKSYEKALAASFGFITFMTVCALVASFFIREKSLGGK